MPAKKKYRLALVTTPNQKVARMLAKSALEAKLVACANLVPGIESHYWWEGRLDKSSEVLVIFKTEERHEAALQELVLRLHPYDTAEFIMLPILTGSPKYLNWITQSVG